MKAEFTPTGGSLATLGDDSLGWLIDWDQHFLEAQEQVDFLAFSSVAVRRPTGNVAGLCVITARKSHASIAAALTFLKGEEARAGQQGVLVLTDTTLVTMAGASLRSVNRAKQDGLRIWVRYEFGITTIS